MTETLTITQPDDFHIHLRDGAYLKRTVQDCAERFARAIVMPNLKPPVTTVETARAYRERIVAATPKNSTFKPLMTLYLTDNTPPETISEAKKSGIIYACKLYPAGATTHSDSGVTNIKTIFPVLEAMQTHQLPLLIHGEVTDPAVDIFDREKYFLADVLKNIISSFPTLKIVLEHISTKEAVDFITDAPDNVAATITAHHLLLNRNALFKNGLNPHHYCLPVLKRSKHQEALAQAALSGNKKFFLGTDSAPHAQQNKENACGCAGIYTAHAGIELYAEFFEQHNAIEKLESFASFHGADFYELERNKGTLTLVKTPNQIPESFQMGQDNLVPLFASQTIQWTIQQ